MDFTLTYDGVLKPNGDINHKQEIRRVFHYQLQELWKGSPVDPSKKGSEGLLVNVGNFVFFPIVSTGRKDLAELQITMLRPGQPPGYIIGAGGDIDNRLKTLFDSLTIPQENSIPSSDRPANGEDPFFCLLEDDILISNLSVATDRLLEPGKSGSYVKLIIRVQTKGTPVIGANMMLRLG
jgi:hypothetical protein